MKEKKNLMKAVVCTKYGPPEVLKIKEVEKPVPGDNEVLIKIHAASVTVADIRVRGFKVPLSFWLPARLMLGVTRPRNYILGSEFAGVVESVGKNVKLFKKRDEVFGTNSHDFGANAEYICMHEKDCLATKPASISFEQAAAIPFGGLTALFFLKQAVIDEDRKVLIYGASGSVGTYAVQIAKHLGAKVTGVCSGTNLDLVKSLGADKVIDYTKEDFTKSGEKYDVIFEASGKASYSGCIKSLKKYGTFLHAVATPAVALRMLITSKTSNIKLVGGTTFPSAEALKFLKELVETGKIKPVIDRTYPLDQIVEAHRYVDKGHKKGNVVIAIRENKK